jgi:DNA polymerase-4
MRHNIVMSANSVARRHGVRAGLSFTDAKLLCPRLQKVTADYPKYLAEAKAAREVFRKYTDKIVPYGLDEGWLYMEDGVTWHEARQIAELIRLEIMYSLGLSASVGVSYNLIFSKIASDYEKPNGLTVITRENYRELVWPLAAKRLLFVGAVRERTLADHHIRTIGDIAATDPLYLRRILRSKVGYDLWAFANGDDRDFHPENDRIGSIGNTITPPKDLRSNEEVVAIIRMLAAAVCTRLQRHRLKARCIALHLRDNHFDTMTRQSTMKQGTDNAERVCEIA